MSHFALLSSHFVYISVSFSLSAFHFPLCTYVSLEFCSLSHHCFTSGYTQYHIDSVGFPIPHRARISIKLAIFPHLTNTKTKHPTTHSNTIRNRKINIQSNQSSNYRQISTQSQSCYTTLQPKVQPQGGLSQPILTSSSPAS